MADGDENAIDVPGEEVPEPQTPVNPGADPSSPIQLAAGPTLESFDKWLTENAREWEAEARAEVVRQAELAIGPHPRGPEGDVFGYWREVLPSSWTDEEVAQYAAVKHWCGGFDLRCIKRAGLAENATWRDGTGFVYPEGLPPTANPKPGDVAYRQNPWQHYAVFAADHGGGKFTTIDGNSTPADKDAPRVEGVYQHDHTSRRGWTFFSIAPLLMRAVENAE